jgi:hypothetical protein
MYRRARYRFAGFQMSTPHQSAVVRSSWSCTGCSICPPRREIWKCHFPKIPVWLPSASFLLPLLCWIAHNPTHRQTGITYSPLCPALCCALVRSHSACYTMTFNQSLQRTGRCCLLFFLSRLCDTRSVWKQLKKRGFALGTPCRQRENVLYQKPLWSSAYTQPHKKRTTYGDKSDAPKASSRKYVGGMRSSKVSGLQGSIYRCQSGQRRWHTSKCY